MTVRRINGLVLMLAGAACPLPLAGCHHTPRQAMSDLWGAVPQVRWSGAREEQPAEPEVAEPSVSANVAASIEPDDPAPGSHEPQGRPAGTPTADPQTPESDSVQTVAGTEQPDEVASPELAPENSDGQVGSTAGAVPQADVADSSVDQIERLKAALNNDVQRARQPAAPAGGAHDARVRVESLLARAQRLFDLGHLREARHTAKVAQDLGDSARLDYSPEEERPIDLVQRIEEQLRESAGQDIATPQDVAAPRDIPATGSTKPLADNEPSADAGTSSIAPVAPAEPGRKPDPEAARPRRDWGLSVFRRDRAAPSAQPTQPTQTIQPAQTVPAGTFVAEVTPTGQSADTAVTAKVHLSLETDSNPHEESDSAVVQANRSLTLSGSSETPPEPVRRTTFDSPAPIAFSTSERPPTDDSAELQLEPDSPEIVPPEPDVESNPASLRLNVPATPTRSLVDASAPPPVDTEEIRPVTPFHDVARLESAETARESSAENDRANQRTGWLEGLAGIGICALVAIFCYRRGAT